METENSDGLKIANESADDNPIKSNRLSHKKLLLVAASLILCIMIGICLSVFRRASPKSQESTKVTISKQFPSVSPTELPDYKFLYMDTLDDALKYPDQVTDLRFCDNNFTSIPKTIGAMTKVEQVDFSENSLTTLPSEIKNLTSLREMILVDNNFSENEQMRIKKLLPNTKIAFIPQKNFNPYIADNWKAYSSTKYEFTFKYHPDLMVKENKKGISIESDLVGFERAFDSCSVEKAFINLLVTIEDNPQNLPPVSYLEKLWNIQIKQQGENYLVDRGTAMVKMIGNIKSYKNGDLDGLIADAGESEHPKIVTSHNHKFYIIQFWPGGETGSGIPDIAKKTLNQTLSTFKYSN